MPEGHSVHRIALQFERDFVGHQVAVSSPQGRFASGAALIDGLTMLESSAVGKHMFLLFEHERWLRIHLGIYGAWDFFGQVSPLFDEGGAVGSIGAPRLRRAVHMAETEYTRTLELTEWPPEPVGQVRVRLETENSLADLRGPMACEVLDEAGVQAVLDRLGPDPRSDPGHDAEERFVAIVAKKPTPIGLLLMDQSVISGIGNVYRAEMLFRARLNPHTPGRLVPAEVVAALWQDWVHLLDLGVRSGQMLTMDDVDGDGHAKALANVDDRHWVYKREGLPCRVCATNIVLEVIGARKLYWCPTCQK